MKIGLATLGFPEFTNAEMARELADNGIGNIQLFLNQSDSRFWKYNGRSDVSSLIPDQCMEIGETYRKAGIRIHSLGVYTNLIHPDPAERAANLAFFESMIGVGDHLGTLTFITEAGHHHSPNEPEPRIPLHFQEEVWHQMVATGRELAKLAESYGAKILLEPFYRGFLASAKRLRLFLEEINSPRVRALLDPANLIEVNDLDEMFNQLAPWIDCIHAKDRKLHVDGGVGAGKGDLDYRTFVTLAAKHAPAAPMILEYVGLKDYKDALAHLRSAMKEAGVKEE